MNKWQVTMKAQYYYMKAYNYEKSISLNYISSIRENVLKINVIFMSYACYIGILAKNFNVAFWGKKNFSDNITMQNWYRYYCKTEILYIIILKIKIFESIYPRV